VRYLVDNALGRLWLLNRPQSRLAEQMEYYIPPEQAETDFLRIKGPEDIKVCDPACGSGHMLTYAFDLLYAMYEEEGYDPAEIAEKILTHNLYGIELDERAGELAAFALTMKARARQRRFFNKRVKPNICVLEKVSFSREELDEYMGAVGRDLFTHGLRETLQQFSEADNFGSLIVPRVANVADVLATLEAKDMAGNLFLADTHQRVLRVLRMADYLSPRYAVVVANPPYMGGKGMNPRLSAWLKENYEPVKSDLFSAFVVRNIELALPKGQLGFMTPFVWMFISSYEKLRTFLIDQKTITSLIQLEYSGFDGATVPICTFTVENAHKPNFRGGYVRLSDFRGADQQGPRALEIIQAARRVGK
jgi:type II restriction/modification system DNA methylase subunit YeeA